MPLDKSLFRNYQKLKARLGSPISEKAFPNDGFMIGIWDGLAVVIGHGSGSGIGLVGPGEVAYSLLSMPGWGQVAIVFLVSCGTGSGSFARRLHMILGGPDVWAPKVCVEVGRRGAVRTGVVDDSGNAVEYDRLQSLGAWMAYALPG